MCNTCNTVRCGTCNSCITCNVYNIWQDIVSCIYKLFCVDMSRFFGPPHNYHDYKKVGSHSIEMQSIEDSDEYVMVI